MTKKRLKDTKKTAYTTIFVKFRVFQVKNSVVAKNSCKRSRVFGYFS
jgi:hypothetical protein